MGVVKKVRCPDCLGEGFFKETSKGKDPVYHVCDKCNGYKIVDVEEKEKK